MSQEKVLVVVNKLTAEDEINLKQAIDKLKGTARFDYVYFINEIPAVFFQLPSTVNLEHQLQSDANKKLETLKNKLGVEEFNSSVVTGVFFKTTISHTAREKHANLIVLSEPSSIKLRAPLTPMDPATFAAIAADYPESAEKAPVAGAASPPAEQIAASKTPWPLFRPAGASEPQQEVTPKEAAKPQPRP